MFESKYFTPNLTTKIIGQNLKYFKTTQSTNQEAWALNKNNIENGTVLFTKNQTNGKGRRGNEWFSKNNKSLTFSILLHKDINELLPLISGISVITAIKKYTDVKCQLKWPNDIIYNNKKIAGILIEKKNNTSVIGIGVNVNENKNDLNPNIIKDSISLALISGQTFILETLLAYIINDFEYYYYNKKQNILDEWMNKCSHMNQEIKFHHNKTIISGQFVGLKKDGRGILNINGEEKIISQGIISL